TLGTWQLLLSRYANTNDVVVGAPVAGRDRGETQDLIGFFVNLLMMRLKLDSSLTVDAFFQRVRTMVLDAFGHQDLPIDMLMDEMEIERQPGYSPLAQAAFQLINAKAGDDGKAMGVGPLEVSEIPSSSTSARMEMVLGVARQELAVTGNAAKKYDYSGSLEYNTDLFNESTVATMVEQYQHILLALTDSQQKTVESIQLFSESELLTALGGDSEKEKLLPLNSYQRDFYLAYKVKPESFENSYGISVDVPDDIDVEKLSQAIQLVANASEMLRARVVESHLATTDDAYFVVHNEVTTALDVQRIDGDLQECADKLMHKPIDILRQPLATYHLLEMVGDGSANKNNSKKLVFCYHHILLDGASTFLHMDAVLRCYAEVEVSDVSDVSDVNSHADTVNTNYQKWDKTHVDSDNVLSFWNQQLKTVEALQFSMPETYRKKQNINAFNDETVSLRVNPELQGDIIEYCRQQNISLPLFFKGVYGILVQHYCRAENDFHVAEFHGNRRVASDTELGCFYQQVPMVFPINLFSKGATVADLFSYEKTYRSQVQVYRSISLSQQANILPQAPAVFMYNYYNFVLDRSIQGETLNPAMSAPKVERGVQMIVGELRDGVELSLRYDLDSFVDLSMLDRMVFIAEQVVSGKAETMDQLNYVLEDEQNSLRLVGGNDQSKELNTELHTELHIVQWFESQVAQSSDKVALVYDDSTLTYKELNAKANQLARYLTGQGVVANSRVGICLDRSIDLIVSILAVLKAGGAYVPMDANYPKERLAFLATDCKAPLVITHSNVADRLPNFENTFLIDSDWSQIEAQNSSNLDIQIPKNDQIYIIYTSGSTGQPKGAVVTHSGELNLQHWYTQEMQFSQDTKTLLVSAVGFDL
ncbi:MAG: AMP-binding protein, partial [Pseudomonadales bacterium]|nr:AMP-binding protein [Pseudomonadales bacterium]